MIFPSNAPRAHTVIDSPLGPLTLVATGAGLAGVHLDVPRHRPPAAALGEFLPAVPCPDRPCPDRPVAAGELLRTAVVQLGEYFSAGRTAFDLPLDLPGPGFRREVLSALLTVPFGTTTTYGALARLAGSPGAARAVGGACGRNPLCVVVPCHRVLGASGTLTGYVGGPERKTYLLELERRAPAAVPVRDGAGDRSTAT